MVILAGDIGGTKTHLALYEDVGNRKTLADEVFVSRDYINLETIIQKFLLGKKVNIERACFGVPGAVIHGESDPTNLPWSVESGELSKKFSIPHVFIINDVEANANGVSLLKPEEFFCLNQGEKGEGNKVIVSAGTGLGEAGLFWDGKCHHLMPSEGGHCDFAPRNRLECALFEYLQEKYSHVSYERALSGPGLENIYNFLVENNLEKGSGHLSAKEIGEKALDFSCKACIRALDMFVSIYGAEAGNMALKFMALGGVYIGGGIAPKILAALKKPTFFEAFCNKGRFKPLLSHIPIHVILNAHTALLGAAHYALTKKVN